MEEIRSLLTAYVTEDEPPIGLSGEAVLSAARLARRRRLLTGAVAVAVVVLALGLAVVVLPHRSPTARSSCPAAAPGESRAALVDRLSCVIGRAVRWLVPADASITRLTIPGEKAPEDPFHLVADEIGPAPSQALFHLGVRVTDAAGSGSVYVLIVPGTIAPPCGEPGETQCRTEPTPQGVLRLAAVRTGAVVKHQATLAGPDVLVRFWSIDSGVLEQTGVALPKQRPEPTLTLEQVRELALTPGLGF
jgi:hypothetical protein